MTVRPDIVFQIGKQEYAIEVETGTILKNNRQQLTNKVLLLREDFGNKWFFVVTDRNLAKAYRRYGKTYTKRNIISKLNKIITKGLFVKARDKERNRANC